VYDASHLGSISTGVAHHSIVGHRLVLLQTTCNYNDCADTHTANQYNTNICHRTIPDTHANLYTNHIPHHTTIIDTDTLRHANPIRDAHTDTNRARITPNLRGHGAGEWLRYGCEHVR
jgi:hypothetical protein